MDVYLIKILLLLSYLIVFAFFMLLHYSPIKTTSFLICYAVGGVV
uniref:Uncharacterized protein n=1 Tax=Meloidogyne enterolobii TaxID=390850 RepID=A0A6V7VC68_MELEN|nr:unnamed protein product [Meloidogyne enterolobii]